VASAQQLPSPSPSTIDSARSGTRLIRILLNTSTSIIRPLCRSLWISRERGDNPFWEHTVARHESEGASTLICSIPLKILHEYRLTRLAGPPTPYPSISTHRHQARSNPLAAFDADGGDAEVGPEPMMALSGLTLPIHAPPPSCSPTPPRSSAAAGTPSPRVLPQEIDKSCLVPHDTTVPRLSAVRGAVRVTRRCTGYCGRTVEGEGDMGPLDDRYYKGRHMVSRFFSFFNPTLSYLPRIAYRLTRNEPGSAPTRYPMTIRSSRTILDHLRYST
jgi:hypothetical protein